VRALDDLPSHIIREMEHFFTVYKDLEWKKTASLGWRDLGEALRVVEAAQASHRAAGAR